MLSFLILVGLVVITVVICVKVKGHSERIAKLEGKKVKKSESKKKEEGEE